MTYAAFARKIALFVPSVSYLSKTWLVAIKPMKGFLNAMPTIMIENICRELPDMYIMMPVIGSCLRGAMATSHAFLTKSVFVSASDGGVRKVILVDDLDWLEC